MAVPRKISKCRVLIFVAAAGFCSLFIATNDIFQYENYNLNCEELFSGNGAAISRAKFWVDRSYADIPSKITCEFLDENYDFASIPSSTEEEDFPLAAVVLLHRNFGQFLRMFEAIYEPQNVYCFSIDMKSDATFQEQIESLADCFENVYISRPYLKIYWGHISVLQAAVNCLRILERSKNEWRYARILSWSDVPLKTNAELVKIYKILDGNNDVELVESQFDRWIFPYYFEPFDSVRKTIFPKNFIAAHSYAGIFYSDPNRTQFPPDNLTLYKGGFGASLTRQLVHFMFASPISHRLYLFLRNTIVPDESFWSTLVHNAKIGAPGSFPGRCASVYKNRSTRKGYITRYDQWVAEECGGQMVHSSCVFGVKDLGRLVKLPHLVAHKVYQEYQPATFYCMMKWIRGRRENLNLSFYRNLPTVRYGKLDEERKLMWNCID